IISKRKATPGGAKTRSPLAVNRESEPNSPARENCALGLEQESRFQRLLGCAARRAARGLKTKPLVF
ncbi:MAG: hypothetical protein ACJ8J7_01070, partial [Sulfurifustaceae bacterium]